MGLNLNDLESNNYSGGCMDSVVISKKRLVELEKKAKAFDRLSNVKEKNPLRAYSYKRLAEVGEDAEKLFRF